ncbi:hypothetical protein [Chitinophaga silvisoli]|uniref:Uncharacterized protein n=1 Tax=Chitinophaga silvisoli TaxID=2291814 RepID=A0A3E1NS44_9BACT|nr:hypothetical protein [Chitinophaga silvisoli]RFM30743.1 hypothetical protein DXN04_32020 [Chitinophaga silvisoli]
MGLIENLKKRTFAKSILIFSLLFIAQQHVSGCDCNMYQVDYYVPRAINIIVAKVISVTPVGNPDDYRNEVIVEVLKVYKGRIKIKNRLTFIMQDNCDPDFRVDVAFLLFCHEIKGIYYSDHCSYSDRISNSGSVIKRIEKILKK